MYSWKPSHVSLDGRIVLGVHVKAWRAVVWIEFAFCRLGVTNAQASWLAQVGRGVLIGQSACGLLTFAREAIDSTHAGSCYKFYNRQSLKPTFRWNLHLKAKPSIIQAYKRLKFQWRCSPINLTIISFSKCDSILCPFKVKMFSLVKNVKLVLKLVPSQMLFDFPQFHPVTFIWALIEFKQKPPRFFVP